MKSAFFLLVPLLANAAPRLDPRQQSGRPTGGLGSLASFMPAETKPYKRETIKPTVPREGVKAVRIWYGPYKLKAANVQSYHSSTEQLGNSRSADAHGTAYNSMVAGIPKDATILRTLSTNVYEDGSKVTVSNGVYNHHVFYSNMAKKAPNILTCPGGKGGAPIPISIFLSSSEFQFTTLDGKFNSGYYIGKNDKIFQVIDLVNYANTTKTVYLANDIDYVEGKVPGMLEATEHNIAVANCDGGSVAVRPKPGQTKFALKSKDMTLTENGYILTMSGHVHDGGVNVVAKINGKQVCESKAVYGGLDATRSGLSGGTWETISSMEKCREPIKVSKGDVLSLDANYDLEKHHAREHIEGGMAEQMALMTTFFARQP